MGTGSRAIVGFDVGGTHTDVKVVYGDRQAAAKALTTYDNFSRGALEALEVAAGQLDLSLEELLRTTYSILNATTVVTNAVEELKGSRVGVLVTAGFKDAFRVAGGPRLPDFDDHAQTNVPDLVERSAIAEILGRIDTNGEELAPLDRDGVRAAASRLLRHESVTAIAVCFLNSHANPAHELAAKQIITDEFPEVFVNTSAEIVPVLGETRRWITAVFNARIQADAQAYMDTIEADFRERGFGGTFAFFQGLGGGITRDRARAFPLALYGSGPAAGAIGANQLARAMGAKNVLVGDMGGTSFDTCFISDNNIQIRKNTEFGRFMTYVNIADVVSIGAGGGSIAWVSERGVPQVGPQSARSTPGPACYGRGGREPTVTDAMVALGFIDPDHYLGGRVRIHPDLAKAALDEVLSDRFGWTTETSATAVHDLVVTNMALALREVSVVKGKDPRDAIFLAYGGCLPLFCCEIADRLGIREVIVPADSSVFSGRGLLSADFKLRSDRTLMWNFDDVDRLGEINQEISEFVDGIVADLATDGFDPARFRVERHADLKYSGQVFELPVPMPDVITEDIVPVLDKEFRRLYEHTYGSGAAWEGVVPTMTTYTVTVTAGSEGNATEALFRRSPLAVREFGPAPRSRGIHLPSERRMADVPIYDAAAVAPGQYGVGPLVIDSVDTTIFVPTGVKVERDTFRNWRLSI